MRGWGGRRQIALTKPIDMETAERILRERFSGDEWDELMQNCGVDVTPSVVDAIKIYAVQMMTKIRKECADNAEIKSVTSYHNFPKVFVKRFKEKKDSVVGIEETLTICKDSILETPITLT